MGTSSGGDLMQHQAFYILLVNLGVDGKNFTNFI